MSTEIDVRIKQDFVNLKPQEVAPPTEAEGIIFLNQLDNKPKYREPQNGTIYNLLTSRYVSKNCVFQSPGDENGLFYWCGTNFGEKAWANDAYQAINVYSGNGTSNPEYGFPYSLLDRVPSTFAIEEGNFSSINIDFLFPQLFYPTGILLRSPHVDTFGFLTNYTVFMLEVLREDSVCNFTFVDSIELIGINKYLYLPIDNTERTTYKLVIIQTGLNSLGTNTFALGGVEVYGKFV